MENKKRKLIFLILGILFLIPVIISIVSPISMLPADTCGSPHFFPATLFHIYQTILENQTTITTVINSDSNPVSIGCRSGFKIFPIDALLISTIFLTLRFKKRKTSSPEELNTYKEEHKKRKISIFVKINIALILSMYTLFPFLDSINLLPDSAYYNNWINIILFILVFIATILSLYDVYKNKRKGKIFSWIILILVFTAFYYLY